MLRHRMRYFTHLTREEIASAGWTSTVNVIYTVEVFFMFLSYLNLKQRIFHWNANLIVAVYTLQYLLSCCSRLVIIFDQFKNFSIDANMVEIANNVRTGCHFVSFYILPCFLFERVCASFFLRDYEKKLRLWIPLLDIGSLLLMTIASIFLFSRELVSLLVTFIFVITINIIGYIGLTLNHHYNIRLHRKTLNRTSTVQAYSLSERFQIAENIKTSELLAKVQLLIFIFSLACATTLLVDHLECQIKTLLIIFSAFNYLCVIYGYLVPVVCVSQVAVWQRELRILWNRALCRAERIPVRHVKGTTGEQLSFNNQADIYFTQFQSMLQDRSRENSIVPIK